MVNSSISYSNLTQVLINGGKGFDPIRMIFVFFMIVVFTFILCCVAILLNVFLATPDLRQNARYVLFIFMILNDTVHVIIGFFLLLSVFNSLYLPLPFCYILIIGGSSTFIITPYTLAVMALERYIAICYPLRHCDLCTPSRACVAITAIWGSSFMVIAGAAFQDSSLTHNLDQRLICALYMFKITTNQKCVQFAILSLCFISVGTVILVTYVKILIIARRMSLRTSSASKASKTVLLHAFQLFLSMASILTMTMEAALLSTVDFLPLFNYFIFTCVPRLLSPLIYGIRDEELRRHIGKLIPKELLR